MKPKRFAVAKYVRWEKKREGKWGSSLIVLDSFDSQERAEAFSRVHQGVSNMPIYVIDMFVRPEGITDNSIGK